MASRTKTREEGTKMEEDVTKLTDEELQQRISGEETPTPEPTAEVVETVEPVEEQVETPEAEVKEVEEGEEEVPPPPSRREQLRINDLLKKYGPPPEVPRTAPLQGMDYTTSLDADPEVVKQLEADRRAAAQQAYLQGQQAANQQVQYNQFYNNIRFDLPLVSDKLSKLDPEDVKSIDEEYMAITGASPQTMTVRNPNIGYAEFVEARLEQAERLAAKMNLQTVKNVTRQAATTGLRPDGSSAKRLNLNQSPDKMTLEELYARTGGTPWVAPKQ